jgi:hypothetical protein
MKFIETSAKTSKNVEDAFKVMTKEIIDRKEEEKRLTNKKTETTNKVSLTNKAGTNLEKKNK